MQKRSALPALPAMAGRTVYAGKRHRDGMVPAVMRFRLDASLNVDMLLSTSGNGRVSVSRGYTLELGISHGMEL